MIHAFALEPRLVATWGRREAFRYFRDRFGLGTTRVLLELPAFKTWKRAVYDAANQLALTEQDMLRIAELFQFFAEHKCRREDSVYDGVLSWLQYAEREYDRRPFAAILATENPRGHGAVLLDGQLETDPRWNCPHGASPPRTPAGLVTALSALILNCRTLHLVDPHFGPENVRHRKVLEALLDRLGAHGVTPQLVRVHCLAKGPLAFFEQSARRMAQNLPRRISVEFVRLAQRPGGEKIHNRYVLTDLGGVSLGVGLEVGNVGETDDLSLLTREQYQLRWQQYVNQTAFDLVDMPTTIHGTRIRPPSGR